MFAMILLAQAAEQPACERWKAMARAHRHAVCVQLFQHRSRPRFTMRGPGYLCTDEHRLALRRGETLTVERSPTESTEARLSGRTGLIRFYPSYWLPEQRVFLEEVPGVAQAYRLKAQGPDVGLPYRLVDAAFRSTLWVDGAAFNGDERDKVLLRRFTARDDGATCDWSLDGGAVGYGSAVARRRTIVTSRGTG